MSLLCTRLQWVNWRHHGEGPGLGGLGKITYFKIHKLNVAFNWPRFLEFLVFEFICVAAANDSLHYFLLRNIIPLMKCKNWEFQNQTFKLQSHENQQEFQTVMLVKLELVNVWFSALWMTLINLLHCGHF